MPSYATSLLPANTGLALGAQNQLWNLWVQFVNGAAPVNFAQSTVAFSGTPGFTASAFFTVFNITLTGNVAASTFTGVQGLVLFQLVQDSIGNRTFVWPAQFKSPDPPGYAPNAVTSQLFYFDTVNAWAIAPGMVYP